VNIGILKPRVALRAAGIVITLGAMAAQAGVYRWVDERGVVHYGDQPTQGADRAERYDRPARASQPAPDGADVELEAPAADGQRKAEIRQEECGKAQTRLTNYREADRLVVKNPDGSEQEMSPEARIDAIVRIEQHVAALCDQPAG
jgi:hypothetical protein